jgi:hypothetical protein
MSAHSFAPKAPRALVAALMFSIASFAAPVAAKLPAPTPDEAAKATAEADKAKAEAAYQQEQLTKSQDRVVAKYQGDLRSRGIAPPKPSPIAVTEQKNLPGKAVEPAGTAGPHGGTTQSAEAHSAPAK